MKENNLIPKLLLQLLEEKTKQNMEIIKPYIGREIKIGKENWVLDSCNDLGVLYWHKHGQKKLFTISSYRIVDLPQLFK